MKAFDFKGKKVLVRVDFNVPLSKTYEITDDTRIRMSLPTIMLILKGGGAVILMSHLGRPLKEKLLPDGTPDKEQFTLRHVVAHLEKLTGHLVHFAKDCVGPVAEDAAARLLMGEILLLENTRFHAGEEKGDTKLAEQMAKLGDIYINDAFGSAHRAHASTAIIAKYFPEDKRGFGLLMEQEVKNGLHILHHAEKPVMAVLGGAKVSDKIALIQNLMARTDTIAIGGAMAFTFLKAQGGTIGNSLVEDDKLELAREIIKQAEETNTKLLLPTDAIVANAFSADADHKVSPADHIDAGWMGLDIGPETARMFSDAIAQHKTLVWNGPMGVFEMAPYANGTLAIARAIATQTRAGAYSLVGGGDSVAAVMQSGVADDISFISTGGGALLELLEGKELPGVAAIEHGAKGRR
ncbi:MAG TPA: phosphoglycerate kinase [Saprospiraceae bacterium]|nr:phosphoglycerate kinase [Saprospiraceae bacterium]